MDFPEADLLFKMLTDFYGHLEFFNKSKVYRSEKNGKRNFPEQV